MNLFLYIDMNQAFVPLAYSSLILLAIWIVGMSKVNTKIQIIKSNREEAANTEELLTRFYAEDKIRISETFNSFISAEGSYEEVYWTIKQRDDVTVQCAKCKNISYLKNNFEYENELLNIEMTHGRITKKGEYDKRYNTDFESNITYFYKSNCLSCGNPINFKTDEKLRQFKGDKIEYIDLKRDENNKMRRSYIFSLLRMSALTPSILYGFFCFSFDKNPTELKNNIKFFISDTLKPANNIEIENKVLSLGTYYVRHDAVDGIKIYKESKKKKNYKDKLMSMEKVDITAIEDSIGYTKLVYGQYRSSGGAWIEMKELVPYNKMFPSEQAGKYHVSSRETKGINIYKDYIKKRKYNIKIASMSEIDITKIVNGMAYTPMYITSGAEIISGWVELDKIVPNSK